MAERKYALQPGGTPRVTITTNVALRDTTVRFDDTLLDTIPDRIALEHGRTFTLPDGSELRVRVLRRMMAYELQVLRNGHPLPGSDTDPVHQVRMVARLVTATGLAWLVCGAATAGVRALGASARVGFDKTSALVGVVLLVLGVFVAKRSRVALAGAIGVFAFDAVWRVQHLAHAGNAMRAVDVAIHLVFIMALVRGFQAMGLDRTSGAKPQIYR